MTWASLFVFPNQPRLLFHGKIVIGHVDPPVGQRFSFVGQAVVSAGDALHPVDEPFEAVAVPGVAVDALHFPRAFGPPVFDVGFDEAFVGPVVIVLGVGREVAVAGAPCALFTLEDSPQLAAVMAHDGFDLMNMIVHGLGGVALVVVVIDGVSLLKDGQIFGVAVAVGNVAEGRGHVGFPGREILGVIAPDPDFFHAFFFDPFTDVFALEDFGVVGEFGLLRIARQRLDVFLCLQHFKNNARFGGWVTVGVIAGAF